MIVVLKPGTSEGDVERVSEVVRNMGLKPHVSRGDETTVVGLIGDERRARIDAIQLLPCVERVIPVLSPFKLASWSAHPEETRVAVGPVTFGSSQFIVIAGPCAVESREQLLATADLVRERGAHLLRGGAFKPRTSPYSFQGLGYEGLEILAEAKKRTGLGIVTEALRAEDLPAVREVADVIQIGARNMQNFSLLEAAAKAGKPVLLKRGMSATLEELLLSAEYLLVHGNDRVILCERGIRTFEKYTRNTLDISAVPVLKKTTHLPVIVDPSHACGRREYVAPLARAVAAVGADGIMVEVHPSPAEALCDGRESVTPEEFGRLVADLRTIAPIAGKTLECVR